MTPRPKASPLVRRVLVALDAGKSPRRSDLYALAALASTRNERTSDRVASLAGVINPKLAKFNKRAELYVRLGKPQMRGGIVRVYAPTSITVGDVQPLAASCLTQAPNRPAATRKRPATATKPSRKPAAKRRGN